MTYYFKTNNENKNTTKYIVLLQQRNKNTTKYTALLKQQKWLKPKNITKILTYTNSNTLQYKSREIQAQRKT